MTSGATDALIFIVQTLAQLYLIVLILRLIMHEWRAMFPVLAQGPNAEIETKLKKSIRLGRSVAYLYWFGIMLTAFFGAVKPF